MQSEQDRTALTILRRICHRLNKEYAHLVCKMVFMLGLMKPIMKKEHLPMKVSFENI